MAFTLEDLLPTDQQLRTVQPHEPVRHANPGKCVSCKEWVTGRVAKSICRPCYQKMYYAFDSNAYAGRQEREYQRAARTLTNMLIEAKKALEGRILEPLEYVTMRKDIDDKLDNNTMALGRSFLVQES